MHITAFKHDIPGLYGAENLFCSSSWNLPGYNNTPTPCKAMLTSWLPALIGHHPVSTTLTTWLWKAEWECRNMLILLHFPPPHFISFFSSFWYFIISALDLTFRPSPTILHVCFKLLPVMLIHPLLLAKRCILSITAGHVLSDSSALGQVCDSSCYVENLFPSGFFFLPLSVGTVLKF